MKTKKKLKLDTLSSKELENNEASNINGGMPPYPICRCICSCLTIDNRDFTKKDNFLYLTE